MCTVGEAGRKERAWTDRDRSDGDGAADELLRRALIDAEAAAAVALGSRACALSDALTVVFHGRADLGTIQTYVAHGAAAPATRSAPTSSCACPCDLDLAEAENRDEAEELYAEQARALRDALVGADTVLAIWREPLEDLSRAPTSPSTARSTLDVRLPAHRLLPVALVAPEKRIVVAAVCGARTLAEGRPPMGIACAQQDVARVYPLPDDPERCLEDFLDARRRPRARAWPSASRSRRPRSQRFLELNGDDPPSPGSSRDH